MPIRDFRKAFGRPTSKQRARRLPPPQLLRSLGRRLASQSIDATQRKTLTALAFWTFIAVSKTLLHEAVFTHVHTPVAFSVLSCVATNVCMSPIFFFKRDLWARPSRASLKGFALVCLAIAVDLGFTNVAISLLSVALQQCIKATSPTATVLLESILERKWQHPAIYAIVCLMVVGPVLAQFGSTFGVADPVGSS